MGRSRHLLSKTVELWASCTDCKWLYEGADALIEARWHVRQEHEHMVTVQRTTIAQVIWEE